MRSVFSTIDVALRLFSLPQGLLLIVYFSREHKESGLYQVCLDFHFSTVPIAILR